MYFKLVESYMRLFISRGESYDLARISAATSLSTALLTNLGALPGFVNSSVVGLFSSVARYPWAFVTVAILLLLINWKIAGKVKLKQLQKEDIFVTRLCYWHLGASFFLLLIGGIVLLR